MCIRKFGASGQEKCPFQGTDNETSADFCPSVWDNFLCWPVTRSGETVSLPCPRLKGNDIAQSAFRSCLENGTWGQRGEGHEPNPLGWTNFSVCINPYIKELMTKVQGSNANLSQNEFKMKHSIAEDNRILEMVGLTLSIVSLLISLIIFYRFRNLQNNRTRIHKNLFIAMSIQVLVRLIVYIDQYMAKVNRGQYYTIETTAYVCELSYILLEYARTAMFLWMFVEGMYLHNMITVAVFQERLSLTVYYIMGWGSPVLMVLIWGVLTHRAFYGFVCWSGYNLSGLFWVLEGPRLLVITLNLLFLLNIIRVLITKLRESNSTEAQQVRKAVRAAIVLLPLLGITNSIQILHSPVDKNIIQFAIWSYVTTFLTSFQGFFCALIYCFLNGEVQLSVKRFIKARRHRSDINRRKSQVQLHGNSLQNSFSKSGSPIARKSRDEELNTATLEESTRNRCRQHRAARRGQKGKRSEEDLFESWSEGELSSHNHVDVEQIEIPMELLLRAGGKGQNTQNSLCPRNIPRPTNSSCSNNSSLLTSDNFQYNLSYRDQATSISEQGQRDRGSPIPDISNGIHNNNTSRLEP